MSPPTDASRVVIEMGRYNTLPVIALSRYGANLGSDEDDVFLPASQVPDGLAIGDRLRVFVFTDSEDRPVATTRQPLATVGEFACLQVVDTTRHGAFLDWGLPKDLFAPAALQHRPMRVGDRVVVGISLHERTHRVIAVGRLASMFDYDVSHLTPGDPVQLLVSDIDQLGAHVIVNGRHRGLVYHEWIFRPLRVGDRLDGYVHRVRDDNRLDIQLQRTGRDASDDAQQIILARLDELGGLLPLHDKSPPVQIHRTLSISKKVFKKAVGALYRARVIEITPQGIRRVTRPS